MNIKSVFVVYALFLPALLNSQTKDTLIYVTTEEIIFKDLKFSKKTPLSMYKDSVTVLDVYQSNFDHVLNRLPGVLATNGENPAQDIRISMRGFGSRSAFGIRGIKIFLDGIPLTSPDGTTQMDEISLYNIHTIEVLKSNMGARLGNAGGGTLSFQSSPYLNRVSVSTRINTFGAYDIGSSLGHAGTNIKNLLTFNHHYFDSRREHSSGQNTVLYNKTFFQLHKNWTVESFVNVYYSPSGQDPGALTLQEFKKNPYQANPVNIAFNAGEEVKGGMTALKSNVYLNDKNKLNTLVFYKKRDFKGRLPFQRGGIVEIRRNFFGLSNVYDYMPNKNHWFSIGQSIELQLDARKRFENLAGNQGLLDLYQNENVYNFSLFQQWQMIIGRLTLHQLLRYDIYKFELSDHYQSDGIQNGNKSFDNLNGSLGFGFQVLKYWNMFLHLGTAFEVPTLNEFSNNPNLSEGFNPTLKPEKSFQVEWGNKILLLKKFEVNSSIYWIHISDLISGYELPETPGRSYFRNASMVRRTGFELSGLLQVSRHLKTRIQYEYSHFFFKKFFSGNNNLTGNLQPIIPKHKIVLFLESSIKDIVDGCLQFGYQSSMFLDDLNLVKSEPLYTLHLSLSSGERLLKNITSGIVWNNIFNINMISNYRANASFSRYYEAASPTGISFFIRYNLSLSEE